MIIIGSSCSFHFKNPVNAIYLFINYNDFFHWRKRRSWHRFYQQIKCVDRVFIDFPFHTTTKEEKENKNINNWKKNKHKHSDFLFCMGQLARLKKQRWNFVKRKSVIIKRNSTTTTTSQNEREKNTSTGKEAAKKSAILMWINFAIPLHTQGLTLEVFVYV